MFALLAALILVVGAGLSGVAFVADGAGPGDPLYGLDQTIEEVKLQLASSDEAEARLYMQFAGERLEEAAGELGDDGDEGEIELALSSFEEAIALLQGLVDGGTLPPEEEAVVADAIVQLQAAAAASGLDAFVAFEVEIEDGEVEVEVGGDDDDEGDDDGDVTGVVEAIGDGFVVIGGQTLILTPDTQINDTIQVGDQVVVEVEQLEDGSLVVTEIGLAGGDDDEGEDDDDEGEDDDDEGEDDDDAGIDPPVDPPVDPPADPPVDPPADPPVDPPADPGTGGDSDDDDGGDGGDDDDGGGGGGGDDDDGGGDSDDD